MNTHKPQVCYKHVFNKFLLNSIRNKEQTKIKKTVSADYGYSNSILISSHISSDLETLCDDLYMIHQGKVIMHEDTDVLLSDYALLKVDEEEYSKLDRQYILRTKKESYGYSCLTNQKQYYAENYPQMAIEKGNIDEVITMMIRGVE